jgi:methyltransferase (TIGR00027 family)
MDRSVAAFFGEGFCQPVTLRPRELASRCWTLVPSAEVLPEETPHSVALAQMEKLRGWRESDVGGVYAAWCLKNSDRAVKARCLRRATSKRDPEFARKVVEEMDRLGFSALVSELRDSARRGAPLPGEDSATAAAANISHTEGGSRTARVTCSARAAAHAMGFGPDSLATLFMAPTALARMRAESERFRLTGDLPNVPEGGGRSAVQALQALRPNVDVNLVSFLQARTCVGDDTIARFIELFTARGAGEAATSSCNVVILGAGYDTRCYRLPLPPCVRLWEVDAPGTQAYKVGVLSSSGVPGRERVTFVAVDFARDADWVGALSAAGCSFSVPTCFLWEGVSMYLPREAVTATLRSIAAVPAPAVLFFDYISPALLVAMRGRMQAAREPWLFAAEPADMADLCAREGLAIVDHLATADVIPSCMPKLPDGTCVGFGSTVKRFVVAVNARVSTDFQQAATVPA